MKILHTFRRNNTLWLLLLSMVPATVQAQFTYTTNDGTITITRYIGPGGTVAIPDTINGLPVTSIQSEAFTDCFNVTNVAIPSSVNSIGNEAFDFCTSLTNITVDSLNPAFSSAGGVLFDKSTTTLIQFPEGGSGSYVVPSSVTSIESNAFANCTSITVVMIPDSVTNIENDAFYDCTNMMSVTIGKGVSILGYGAFFGCTRLASVTIPDNITSLGIGAFGECFNLTNLMIGASVTNIGSQAFYECGSLTNVTIPNSVASIGSWAFGNCTNLAYIAIPDSVISIAYCAFDNCTKVTGVTIGKSLTNLDVSAFAGCASLTSITVDALNPVFSSVDGVLFDKCQTTLLEFPVLKSGTSYTIPNSVTSIGPSAFEGCTGLSSVTIGNSVTNIGSDAFLGCAGLFSVIIGRNLASIGSEAFAFCPGFFSIYFEGNAPSLGENVFWPHEVGCVYYLKGTTGWTDGEAVILGLPIFVWTPQMHIDDLVISVLTNQFGFTITGSPSGLQLIVEACTNLANPAWSSLGTNVLTDGLSYFSDPAWTNFPSRFYRLRLP